MDLHASASYNSRSQPAALTVSRYVRNPVLLNHDTTWAWWRILLAAAVMVATARPVTAHHLFPGEIRTNQFFTWRSDSSSRSAGTYLTYAFPMEANTTYVIRTYGAYGRNTDTYLYLFNDEGALVAEDDDGNGNLASKIVFRARRTGLHWVRLRAYERGAEGYCTIAVTSDSQPNWGTLRPGDRRNDQYFAWETSRPTRASGSYATVSVEMQAGATYVIETANAHGTSSDTYLYLLDAGERIVAEDDDSNGRLASRLVYRPARSGVYTVKLRAYRRGTAGFCTLTVSWDQRGGVASYPDLAPVAAYLGDVQLETVSGRNLLRFSSGAVNLGPAPLELSALVEPDGMTRAYQRVWYSSGSYDNRLAGTFLFAGHADHNHWHFDEFAAYRLRTVRADGGVGGIVAESAKVSFCLMDVAIANGSRPGATTNALYNCDFQGISVGWADIYGRWLEGQFIDVTAAPAGMYWLEMSVDPAGRLAEVDETNNTTRIKIYLDTLSNRVVVIS